MLRRRLLQATDTFIFRNHSNPSYSNLLFLSSQLQKTTRICLPSFINKGCKFQSTKVTVIVDDDNEIKKQQQNDDNIYNSHTDEALIPSFCNSSNYFNNTKGESTELKKSTNNRRHASVGVQKQEQKRKSKLGTTMAEWIVIRDIPPLSTLDDLLVDIQRIVSIEFKRGITDLDVCEEQLFQNQHQPFELPLWKPTSDYLPPHMVIEAHMMLTKSARVNGWFLRFPNRSIVNAIFNHLIDAQKKNKQLDTQPLMCAWKELKVYPFFPNIAPKKYYNPVRKNHATKTRQTSFEKTYFQFHNPLKLDIGEHVLRVENCHASVNELLYLFSTYRLDHTTSTPVEFISNKSFLVRFESKDGARAALREKQLTSILGRKILLSRYSRQIFAE